MKMVFAYKNGRLKKVSTADTLIKNTKYTARRNVKFYSKIGNNGTGFTLKKGQKVLLDKVRMFRGKLYFRGRFNGKRGWFTYNGKEFISNSNRFFEEVMFVG